MIVATIPPSAELGKLSVDMGDGLVPYEHSIHLGRLAPASELLGVQQRLMNLGYECPQMGLLDDDTRAALEAFQLDYGLPLTREADKETQKLLEELHKS
jgi:N-acetyl-anhydromuramyl-L-alanine amidase AmpD